MQQHLSFCVFLLLPLLTKGQTTPDTCQEFIPSINVTCPADSVGVSLVYADPEHCSRYWECYRGCATNLLCQLDYLFDDVNMWCNTPEDVICWDRPCDGRPCATNPPPTVEPPFFDCPEPEGLYADPTNCIKYFQCANDRPIRNTCPVQSGQQLYWHTEREYCDFLDNMSCGERPICDGNDENCLMQTTAAPTYCDRIECEPGDDQYIAQGPCDQCFCECVPGHATASEICCQDGLFWHPAIERCDYFNSNPGCQGFV